MQLKRDVNQFSAFIIRYTIFVFLFAINELCFNKMFEMLVIFCYCDIFIHLSYLKTTTSPSQQHDEVEIFIED
ncbi:CLUMA_CG001578, isoform A [Clunio marinus]|uniref:CLUMA_CG001578, isoform A n=1 Tax=Clunio marinus TaxID=568069 RepID=A0A1J1HNJ6_9DIPT|nr:CLUMA_CG001578, isoform A [Clunio marinus]